MKIFEIALFMLCFNVSIFLINQTGAFPSQFIQSADQAYIEGFEPQAKSLKEQDSQLTGVNDFVNAFGNYIGGTVVLVIILWQATVGMAPLISDILGGSAFANTIGGAIAAVSWFMYIAAIVQWRGNRALRSME